jgi:hypothetical protein
VPDIAALCVDVYEKPSRSVVTRVNIEPRALVLLPETFAIKIVQNDELAALSHTKPFGAVCAKMPSGPDGVSYMFEPRVGRYDVCPFWYVTPVTDALEANLVWSTYRAQNLIGTDEIKSETGKALRRVHQDDEAVVETCVEVPVLVNALALEAGTRLNLFHSVPDTPRKGKQLGTPITVGAVQKRARV